MIKAVFSPKEVNSKDTSVVLRVTKDFTPVEDEAARERVIDEARERTLVEAKKRVDEAAAAKETARAEAEKILRDAREEAERVIDEARERTLVEAKKRVDEAAAAKETARAEAEQIVRDAREEAERITAAAKSGEQAVYDEARRKATEEGRESGFSDGKAEVDRLIERLRKMIEGVQNRRAEILDGTEQQIVNLVILIARRVVKILSESQEGVTKANVLEALKKVKGSTNITLRVNLADLKLTTDHIKEFISRAEGIKGITVEEDSTVDRGGCIVETDFGAIDARIQSQLNEIERQILNISPIQTIDALASLPGEGQGGA